ncbi:hypothetical protein Q5752_002505 [Cryptotrichosporon argae]
MAKFEVFANVQPWEEQQSPSPEQTTHNPYETTLALARSRSSSHPTSSSPLPSLLDRTASLQRQLSGDPDAPPQPWKRRSSVAPRHPPGPDTFAAPPSRRHPSLTMTVSRATPHSLADTPETMQDEYDDLPLPQPSFRRGTRRSFHSSHSNRSSTISIEGLNSEELWALEQQEDAPDLANPHRPSSQRPLDTVRLSQHSDANFSGLPQEIIWPIAPAEAYVAPVKSKSFSHVPSISRRPTKSRKPSVGSVTTGVASAPISPMTKESPLVHSANSSSTSLHAQSIKTNKSQPQLARPMSGLYAPDFLHTLAPREGGYAVAAMMSAPEVERRRSMLGSEQRPRSSRAPLARSAGMGRWSLDGGEEFTRKVYATPSAATTSSNLSQPPITSEMVEELAQPRATLPAGASPAVVESSSALAGVPVPAATAMSPPPPQPVLQTPTSAPAPAATPAVASSSTTAKSTSTAPAKAAAITQPKSKKQLAKEVKAQAKADAINLNRERAEAARQAVRVKAREREAAAKAKEEARHKAKEEEQRLKAEKKANKLKSSSVSSLPFSRKRSTASVKAVANSQPPPPVPAVPPIYANHTRKAASESVPAVPAELGGARPRPVSVAPARDGTEQFKRRTGFFGTLRKRFSTAPEVSALPSIPASPLPHQTASLGKARATERDAMPGPSNLRPVVITRDPPGDPVIVAPTPVDVVPQERVPARNSSLFAANPLNLPGMLSSLPSLAPARSHDLAAATPLPPSPSPSPALSAQFPLGMSDADGVPTSPSLQASTNGTADARSDSTSAHLSEAYSSPASTEVVTPASSATDASESLYGQGHGYEGSLSGTSAEFVQTPDPVDAMGDLSGQLAGEPALGKGKGTPSTGSGDTVRVAA